MQVPLFVLGAHAISLQIVEPISGHMQAVLLFLTAIGRISPPK